MAKHVQGGKTGSFTFVKVVGEKQHSFKYDKVQSEVHTLLFFATLRKIKRNGYRLFTKLHNALQKTVYQETFYKERKRRIFAFCKKNVT